MNPSTSGWGPYTERIWGGSRALIASASILKAIEGGLKDGALLGAPRKYVSKLEVTMVILGRR